MFSTSSDGINWSDHESIDSFCCVLDHTVQIERFYVLRFLPKIMKAIERSVNFVFTKKESEEDIRWLGKKTKRTLFIFSFIISVILQVSFMLYDKPIWKFSNQSERKQSHGSVTNLWTLDVSTAPKWREKKMRKNIVHFNVWFWLGWFDWLEIAFVHVGSEMCGKIAWNLKIPCVDVWVTVSAFSRISVTTHWFEFQQVVPWKWA